MSTTPYLLLRFDPMTGLESPIANPAHTRPAKITVTDLSPGDVRDAKRDPNTQVAPSGMPLALVEPTQRGMSIAPAGGGAAWGLQDTGATASAFDGSGVRVAVLDTGVDDSHAAFAGMTIQHKNFTADPPGDTDGHGTHCAGTIAGQDVGGFRIGVAPKAELLSGKVLGTGGGTNEVLLAAMDWAVSQDANIISMSLGVDFPGWVQRLEQSGMHPEAAVSRALEDYRSMLQLMDAYTELQALRGVLIVAATGNESRHPTYEINVAPPAAASHILSVGAVKQTATGHDVAAFSNTNPDIVAPGVGVRSAEAGTSNGLVDFNGTSMATPHVAGLAALHLQQLRSGATAAGYQNLKAALLATASPATLRSPDPRLFGAGLATAP